MRGVHRECLVKKIRHMHSDLAICAWALPPPVFLRFTSPSTTLCAASSEQEEWVTTTANTVVGASGSGETFNLPSVLPPGGFPPSFQAAKAALKRKYRHLRRALGKDGMLFADEIFEIRPLEGEIWARSEIEVSVSQRLDISSNMKEVESSCPPSTSKVPVTWR